MLNLNAKFDKFLWFKSVVENLTSGYAYEVLSVKFSHKGQINFLL
ncbi:hypothetical protein [Campylobacter geochelonis]|nr:hypothetical protein [Campylobacter geochelonis]